MARRGGVVLWALYFFICYCFYVIQVKRRKTKIKLVIGALIVFSVLISIYLSIEDYSLFDLLMSRGLNDTRSTVEISFYKDMDATSWLFGRTWFGTYYEPEWGKYRSSIETGFLALILRGGVVYLILYLSVLLPSAYKGLFKSNNSLVKAFATIIFFHIIELYPYGWPSFTIGYYTVWLGVYICQSSLIRRLSDDDIRSLYFSR